jgi:HAMP domain-containing protein
VDIPSSLINSAVWDNVWKMILASLILTLLALLGIPFIADRLVSKPVIALSQAAERIAIGDLNVKLTVNSKNELGDMTARLAALSVTSPERRDRGGVGRANQAGSALESINAMAEKIQKAGKDAVQVGLFRSTRSPACLRRWTRWSASSCWGMAPAMGRSCSRGRSRRCTCRRKPPARLTNFPV